MEFLNGLIETYSSFFSWEVLQGVLTNPANWTVILSLVILEGLLSADNALVLAVMVNHLPDKQKKRALFYGLIGAYLFRFLAIGLGVFLVKMTAIKVMGALYLLKIAADHFFGHNEKAQKAIDVLLYLGMAACLYYIPIPAIQIAGGLLIVWLLYRVFKNSGDEEGEMENKGKGFWQTVLAVEMMDIAFSIDSVLAAFGVSNQVWVLFLGGILGVLMMRGVAQVFLKLIERIPEFETTAFVLIALISIKMFLGAAGFHIESYQFFSVLVLTFLGTFIVHTMKKRKAGDQVGSKEDVA
ncbi:MAG: TerC family protein [Clostridia bacterium]